MSTENIPLPPDERATNMAVDPAVEPEAGTSRQPPHGFCQGMAAGHQAATHQAGLVTNLHGFDNQGPRPEQLAAVLPLGPPSTPRPPRNAELHRGSTRMASVNYHDREPVSPPCSCQPRLRLTSAVSRRHAQHPGPQIFKAIQ